ncbi:hypothetical protein KV134_11375 [Tetragenococcus halophilus]|nr:hypothetical protein [Tetragenococcus halophilus]NWO01219.1 hypothetical protein [Tetragenococcus halophilus]QXN86724.1 hypothetical protein KV134_11375 [Tetragenococcus halophilus]RQD29665.1 hypothetical protein C7K42_12505 [Tetragenococcus halophilus subsp. halophilus DSM 20339]BAK95647.1 hypothetical protein TEH_23200 [Tetragenococcus halophilus NBRC 12172]
MVMMTEKKELITKKNQPIKAITQQDLHKLKETLEELQSWVVVLEVIDKFFKHEKETLNKKKIIQEYHANAKIFEVFLDDFLVNTNVLESQFEELRSREKIHF